MEGVEDDAGEASFQAAEGFDCAVAVADSPDVFCAIARTTGETLDTRRTPTPAENDLAEIAEAFVAWSNGDREQADASELIKLEPAHEFSETKRWDVPRFWDDDELVDLGVRVPPMERGEFVDENVAKSLRELLIEFEEAQAELASLTPEHTKKYSIGDSTLFAHVPRSPRPPRPARPSSTPPPPTPPSTSPASTPGSGRSTAPTS